MDRELKNLHLNISQLAALSGAHRQTVAARVKNISPAGGHESNLKLYRLTDILAELMKNTLLICPACGQQSPVHDRRHRKWRCLDTCQFMALFEADVPHVIWSNHWGYAAARCMQECAAAGL